MLAALLAVALALPLATTTPSMAAAPAAKSAGGTLTVEAQGVTVLKQGATTFTKAKSKQKVSTGDTVQTDPTGLAQITFPDGSLTRLDHDTVFTLEKLVTKTGRRQVEGTVSAGQTWNRVQKLTETESFRQTGNGATAAVLGTAFLTRCSLPSGVTFRALKTKKALKRLRKASTCKFTLVDGRLQLRALGKITALARGQWVEIDGAGNAGIPQTVPPDVLFSDQWMLRNLELDARAGVSEARGTPTAEDLAYARIEGAWPVTLQVTSNAGFRDLVLGDVRTRTYRFIGTCEGGTCTTMLHRDTAVGTRVIPLTYDGGVYSGTDPDLGTQDCERDDGTIAVPGGLRSQGTITFRVANAVPLGGLWRAMEIVGTVTETAEQVAGPLGQCRTGSATFELVAARGA